MIKRLRVWLALKLLPNGISVIPKGHIIVPDMVPAQWHSVPEDGKEHIRCSEGRCWCNPTRDQADPTIVVHNAVH